MKTKDLFYEYGMLRQWVYGVFIILTILGLMLAAFTPMYFIEKKSCSEVSESMEIETKFGLWTGCMYRIGGNWVRDDNYRKVEKEKEEEK